MGYEESFMSKKKFVGWKEKDWKPFIVTMETNLKLIAGFPHGKNKIETNGWNGEKKTQKKWGLLQSTGARPQHH